jgi:hypothetical protein
MRYRGYVLLVVFTVPAILASLHAARSDDKERVARVTGRGVAAFDAGEELFGYETGWAVLAAQR